MRGLSQATLVSFATRHALQLVWSRDCSQVPRICLYCKTSLACLSTLTLLFPRASCGHCLFMPRLPISGSLFRFPTTPFLKAAVVSADPLAHETYLMLTYSSFLSCCHQVTEITWTTNTTTTTKLRPVSLLARALTTSARLTSSTMAMAILAMRLLVALPCPHCRTR